jgi:UDP-2,3-diacylglucosamine pyrophosphatase LpxH
MVHPSSAIRHDLRTVFISDVHLGSRACRAEALLDFLRGLRTETLFLVGDIVDLWSLRRSVYWPDSHTAVLQCLLGKAREGTRVVYIPGNHDHTLRGLAGHVFGPLETHREVVHETADGRRLLVLHGDEFDGVVRFNPAVARLGCAIYDTLIAVNPAVNALRALLGLPAFSLAARLKHATPTARRYMQNFEEAAALAARRRGLDGVVCGHIHHPACRELGGVLYCNDGDWVESCTALVEEHDGALSVRHLPGFARPAALRAVGAARAA